MISNTKKVIKTDLGFDDFLFLATFRLSLIDKQKSNRQLMAVAF